ncbi:FAD dependent oxidoreductase [Olsenella uli DSM 7084]|uniref:FAD dependent oxidoreductase n=1 Tax=Olsenella uli (strain ATCC 49627 / DSM 7084 / CCUG 31166 / CIP 109912 / JCM 12494 / LMG 11480 / NCIMB 702895 / VPI D76D-27C) TaxID=633147 RepID=E1QWB3_OLSUV|nr:NAD(P)-binding protein [Olsenella uli]ADK68416.1 FAD dependent oxidoreductase [Olsenella uli DSM 7084]KRO12778.1 FAD dependent oxidoreductase [Olsenella uli DSM 7084]
MLDISNIRVPLDQLDGTAATEDRALRAAVLRRLRITPDDLAAVEPRKRSIDARKKGDVHLTYTVRIQLRGAANAERSLLERLRRRHAERGVSVVDDVADMAFRAPVHLGTKRVGRPVVVGAGCAGLFCALALAEAGLEPLLVERGQDSGYRSSSIERFNRTGKLDVESNIQFGLGGAGTFSDGKLATGTKSPLHRHILKTFVACGAQREILYDAKPHVGSDVLPTVVTNMCRRIGELGGEVRFSTRMVDLDTQGGCVRSITLRQKGSDSGFVVEERLPAANVVVACGHSARDVFELLRRRGVSLERKTFAMGVRIEHLQRDVDRAQYGPFAGHPALGAAPYKLVTHLGNGRSAFSFCMCPGGYVVAAASEEGGVVTNGMSLSDRKGENANSGLLANVFPDDLPGDDVLAGVELQRRCERSAYEAGGGDYLAPAQLVGDFLQGVPSSGQGSVTPTYPRGVSWGDVATCLPGYVSETLRAAIPRMDRRLHGFSEASAVLTGVETRSSSPVRVTRGEGLQSLSTAGLWPCGEGAGYAGGIMSAATDGLRVARTLVESLE